LPKTETTKQISITLEIETLQELEAFRQKLGLLSIQDAIRLLIPQGLKVYKKGERA